jgi:hypothetical protein
MPAREVSAQLPLERVRVTEGEALAEAGRHEAAMERVGQVRIEAEQPGPEVDVPVRALRAAEVPLHAAAPRDLFDIAEVVRAPVQRARRIAEQC